MNNTVKLGLTGPALQAVNTEEEHWYDMQLAAKIMNLGFGRTTLFRHLRKLDFLMEDNVPYQSHIDNGLFKVILKDIHRRNGSLLFRQTVTLISLKGIEVCKRKILELIQN